MNNIKKVIYLLLGLFIFSQTSPVFAKAGTEFKYSLQLLKGAKSGKIADVKTGLKNGANINVSVQKFPGIDNNLTPLMLAAKYGHLQIVKFLVDEGAIVTLKNRVNGKIALDYAKLKKHKKIIAYLKTAKSKHRSLTRSTTTSTAVKKKRKYLTLSKVYPKKGRRIKPGKPVSFVINYDIPRSESSGPCKLTTAFDHKMGMRSFDTNIITEEKGQLKLKYIISEYDLAHLRYRRKFKVQFQLTCPNPSFGGKLHTFFQTMKLNFKNGQRRKTRRQKKYRKGQSIYSHRVEVLYRDRVYKSGGVKYTFKKGKTIVYKEKKYIINSGNLKRSVTSNIYGKKIRLKARTFVYFDENGKAKGGTVAKTTRFKSGETLFVLRKGTSFESLENGLLSIGTIAKTAKIAIDGNEYSLASGSRLGFFASGLVRIFITKKPMKLKIGKREIPLPKNTQVMVHDKSDKIKEIYNARKTFDINVKDRIITFDNMHGIVFTETGSLSLGLLKSAEKFKIHGQVIPCRRSVVIFNADESFGSCDVAKNLTVNHADHKVTIKKNTRPGWHPNGNVSIFKSAKPYRAQLKGGSIRISAGKHISFFDTGILKAVMLENNETFKVGGHSFTFYKGSHVKLYPDGNVAHGGTLYALRVKDKNREYRVISKSRVKFNQNGEIIEVRTAAGIKKLSGPVTILETIK